MKLYITPKGGGPVIVCDSQEAVSKAVESLRAEGYGEEFDCTRGDIVCDFCSFPEVVNLYTITPDRGFGITIDKGDHMETHGDGDGKWAACEECGKLISEREWYKLAVRSVERMVEGSGLPVFICELTVSVAHGYFRTRWERDGCPEPVKLISDAELLGQ